MKTKTVFADNFTLAGHKNEQYLFTASLQQNNKNRTIFADCFRIAGPKKFEQYMFVEQSVPQHQKSVNFLHNLISLDQLLQHLKHAAEVCLTFMSKYFSYIISDNVKNVV